MDAYLSREAFQSLTALSLVSSNSIPDGFLIGHKRGHRFFVEKIFPSQEGFFPSLEKYQDLDKLYEGKILGFFSFRSDEKKLRKIMAPFAYRKLFLEINLKRQKEMSIKPYLIDHEKEFLLEPIKLKKAK
ncbi:MAG: hypothetical protein PVF66_14575 [Candidatus Aminicenantes bacterium]|jgi:hypothetical protein